MSHWAELDDNNKVIRILVGDNNDPNGDFGYKWLIDNLGGTWVQTSYNTRGGIHALGGIPFGKNYAAIGYTWDGVGFYAPKPFASWTLNENSYLWEAPTPMPNDEKLYTWDETTLSWIEINI